MDGMTLLAFFMALALGGYLALALMKPEWFS